MAWCPFWTSYSVVAAVAVVAAAVVAVAVAVDFVEAVASAR